MHSNCSHLGGGNLELGLRWLVGELSVSNKSQGVLARFHNTQNLHISPERNAILPSGGGFGRSPFRLTVQFNMVIAPELLLQEQNIQAGSHLLDLRALF